jgi:hypothetical protein
MNGLWEIVAVCDEYGRGRLVIVAGGLELVIWLWPHELSAALEMCLWRNDTIRRAHALERAAA